MDTLEPLYPFRAYKATQRKKVHKLTLEHEFFNPSFKKLGMKEHLGGSVG